MLAIKPEFERIVAHLPKADVLEDAWSKALLGKYEIPLALPEELTRCTLLHGLDANGNDGFSICDPVAAVGWHEIIQVCPKWDGYGKPYIYILCLGNGKAEHCFLRIVGDLLKANKINDTITELEE